MNMYDYKKITHGTDIYIADNVVIKHPSNVKVGSHIAIDDFFYMTTALDMGSYCHISSHVSIVGGKTALLTMGNFSHLSAGARLIVMGDENLGSGLVSPVIPGFYRDKLVGGRIVIEDFVSVLTNAIVAPGVTLGEGCLLAAGGFAKTDIPPWEIWGGVPAKFLKTRSQGNMLKYAKMLQEQKGLGYD